MGLGKLSAALAVAGSLVVTAALAGTGPASASPRSSGPAPGAQVAAVSRAEQAGEPAQQATQLVLASAGQQPPGTAPPVPAAAKQAPAGSRIDSGVYPGGGLFRYGDAESVATLDAPDPPVSSPIVGMAADHGGTGMWLAAADGAVYTDGNAVNYGSLAGHALTAPVVGIAATPTGGGYWLVALDGGVFTFGNAAFYGSAGGIHLNQPVVGMAATPTGHGYWLVAADGGIFTYGNAIFRGSTGGIHLNQPVVGMAATPTGGGYWLVAADGGIFTFGNATFHGSAASDTLQSGIVGMAATPRGTGYWLLEWSGAVFTFGSAESYGEPTVAPTASPFRQLVPTSDGEGYWLLEPDGFDDAFSDPPATGGYPAIVSAAASQIQPDPDGGYFCNPYGTCEPWCALFVTWAWERAGVSIPSYAFVGNIDYWAAAHGAVLPPSGRAVAGDAILFGTGPQNVATAVHTGIVAQVWPDGAVVTIEGDAGPGVTGHLAVIVNGPFLPDDAEAFADYPVFAIAQP